MKNIIWIGAVLVIAILGDRVGGFVLSEILENSQFRYSRLYRGEEKADLVFAGNSRGLIFYQPYIEEKMGLSTVNLSYNGMPMELAEVLIKDYLDRNKTPKLLVLDITLLDQRMDSRLVSAFNCYTPFSGRLPDLLKDSFPNDYYAGQVSHLYRYNSEVFQRAFYYLKKSDEDWLLDRVISPTLQKDVQKQEVFDFDFTNEMLVKLAEVVKYAQQKGVRVELVVNPYYPPFAEKIGNLAMLKNACEKATGLPIRDYSQAISNVDGFGDYQHLNKQGAKEYLDSLMEDGVLDLPQELGVLEEK